MNNWQQLNLWNAIRTIRYFIDEKCEERLTCLIVVKEDRTELRTDWGYFEEGLNEIERWLNKQ